ncbi:hypothetical protein AYM40_15640 [Paraburkholderia phytofirmans OLGA172]|uniref:Uncharacterized protein n=1 Tax=Paraburkholderia phytofirmans OLGA172 TaxID=1417228 RepID=A0A160FM08_9BURK|nr:hypothetical protein AYM40_15640 [Paraburkholderia phytofirmans OLGA172]
MTTTSNTESRFFYHSFPRRQDKAGRTAVDQGLCILEGIRDFGILLTPEVIRWQTQVQHGDRGFVERVQRRACFTELAPSELPGHAETFGSFTLEFGYDTIRALGALPVTYVPKGERNASDGSMLGTELATTLLKAQAIVNVMAAGEMSRVTMPYQGEDVSPEMFVFKTLKSRNFTVTSERDVASPEAKWAGTWASLAGTLDFLVNLFYPADDVRPNHAGDLKYYRQREWRIVGRMDCDGEEVVRELSPDAVARMLAVDPAYFGKPPRNSYDDKNVAELTMAHTGIGGKSILQLASRILVPEEALGRARKIVAGIPGCGAVDVHPEKVTAPSVNGS